ncbi:MAG: lysoplasmalogenase [Spirochaetales bacterium]|nr:lysoplasmalogenase [Spirochaetales bacterium]
MRLYHSVLYFGLGITYIILSMSGYSWPALAVKALPIWLLAALVWKARLSDAVRRAMTLALICGSMGDILLSLPVAGMFIPGLVAFLIGHILYGYAFFQLRSFSALGVAGSALIIGFAVTMGILIAPRLPAGLIAPVLLYIAAIAAMGVQASFKKGSHLSTAGAVLFLVSDSLIAINRFVEPVMYSTLFIMVTYYPAQYLLSRSVLEISPEVA